MARIVLVTGLLTHDSGKTWFLVELAKFLKSRGLRVAVYKPVAGHSAWHQFDTVVRSMEMGVLIGSDVASYIDELGMERDLVDLVNPVDLLLAPPDPYPFIARNMLREYVEFLESQVGQIVLARFSRCLHRSRKHLVVEQNLERTSPTLRNVLRSLVRKLDAEPVDIDEVLKLLRSSEIARELEICLDIHASRSDVVLVESFNDAVTPSYNLLRRADRLVLVMPSAIAVYSDVDRIAKILELEARVRGDEAARTSRILKNIVPDAIVYVEPRASRGSMGKEVEAVANLMLR